MRDVARRSLAYGFRDRTGSSCAPGRLIRAIERFDRFESGSQHMALTVELPSAFLRYAATECMPYRDWGEMRIRIEYGYHGVEIVIGLAETSRITSDVRVKPHYSDVQERYEWYRLEQAAPLRLSLADAQRFVIFLMNHFLCFDLTITTRLSR